MTEVCVCVLVHAHINTIHTPHNVHIQTFMVETPPNSINVACDCLVRNASEKWSTLRTGPCSSMYPLDSDTELDDWLQSGEPSQWHTAPFQTDIHSPLWQVSLWHFSSRGPHPLDVLCWWTGLARSINRSSITKSAIQTSKWDPVTEERWEMCDSIPPMYRNVLTSSDLYDYV